MFLFDNILDIVKITGVYIALFMVLGYILQRYNFWDALLSIFWACLGFALMMAGNTLIKDSLDIFAQLFKEVFQISGVIPSDEIVTAEAQNALGMQTSIIMFGGIVLSLVIAKFSPWKYIFLTGNYIFFMAALIAVIFASVNPNMNLGLMLILGSIILAFSLIIFPALLQYHVKKITKKDDIAIAHFNAIAYLSAGLIGQLVGKIFKTKGHLLPYGETGDTNNVAKSPLWRITYDTIFTTFSTMFIIFVFMVMLVGSQFHTLYPENNPIIFSFSQAIKFTAALYIIFTGVRLFINEIKKSFIGIQKKLIPEAKIALFPAILFPQAPTATIVGFLCHYIGQVIAVFLFPFMGLTVIIPFPHFIGGATAGVFAYKFGGYPGCIVGSIVAGFITVLGASILYPYLMNINITNTTFDDVDFALTGIITDYIARLF